MGLASCLSLFWGERAGPGSRSTSPAGVPGRTLGSAAPGSCPLPCLVSLRCLAARSAAASPLAADPDPLLLTVPGAPVAPPVRWRRGSGVAKTVRSCSDTAGCLAPHHHSDKYPILGSRSLSLFKKEGGLGLVWRESFRRRWGKWERAERGAMVPETGPGVTTWLKPWKAKKSLEGNLSTRGGQLQSLG